MPGRTLLALLAIATLVVSAPAARAGKPPCANGPAVYWSPVNGGNGHFYQFICAARTWSEANAEAIATGRHLATITSEEENDFVFELVDDENLWVEGGTYGPWIGGVQPPGSTEPAGGWTWVTGEDFSFTAWFDGQPSNTGEEDRIHYFDDTGFGVISAQWNDLSGAFSLPYIVEWEHTLDADFDGETEPLTDGMLILRWLFQMTGTDLTGGAVDTADCKRCDASSIEPFLEQLSAGGVYDLTADWSESNNPNGPWSYRQGTTTLGHVASWLPGSFTLAQPAWATAASGSGHIPAFFKAVEAQNDFLAGDVVIHSRDDANGGGQGDARLRFTVPSAAFYHLVFEIWITRDIGRTVNWALSVAGNELASSSVASGDVFSRSSPSRFASMNPLQTGTQIDVVLSTPAAAFGDMAGVRLRVAPVGLDVDGNGEADPLTDGRLILRYLFGFRGATLIEDAVDLDDCTRCSANSIESFLDSFA